MTMRRAVSLLAVLVLLLGNLHPVARSPRLVQVGVAAVLRGAAEGYASVRG